MPLMSGHHLRERHREPARLDSLNLYEQIRPEVGTQFVTESLLDAAGSIFVKNVDEVAKEASTLYGWRAENLFRGVVVSLDSAHFIKDEDSGRLFFKGKDKKQPDFRIVTDKGATLLVEVKNKSPSKPREDFTMSHGELESLRAYCQLSPGAELKIAVYWAGWNLWTLTDPQWFTRDRRRARLSLHHAMKHNEMLSLGDVTLATEMPLALRVFAETSKPRQIADDGSCSFTVGRVELLVAGNTIENDIEQKIAYTLMMFGGWTDVTTSIDRDGVNLISITSELQPETPVVGQSFQLHGPLSSLFSTYFGIKTLSSDGTVRSLDAAYKPGGLRALVEEPYEGDVLSLWRFSLQPS